MECLYPFVVRVFGRGEPQELKKGATQNLEAFKFTFRQQKGTRFTSLCCRMFCHAQKLPTDHPPWFNIFLIKLI